MLSACSDAATCTGFKLVPLKTHANTSKSSNHILKTIQLATTKQLESKHKLKITCIPATIAQNPAQDHEESLRIPAPALRRHASHAPTQLRLARTHKRLKIKIDFPAPGTGQIGVAPLDLRYIHLFLNIILHRLI